MSAVAPSNEKQTVERELAEARALIDEGEYEAALDQLATVREVALAQEDAEALEEVRGLARTVWRHAPRGSAATERADSLWRQAIWQQPLTRSAPPQARRSGLGTWSVLVLVAWLVVSVVAGATAQTSWLFSRGELIFFALLGFGVMAVGVWLLGLLVYLGRTRHWGRTLVQWVRREAQRRSGRVLVVAVALVLVATGAAVFFTRGGPGFPSGAGGGRIVFEHTEKNGVTRIYLMNADGSQQLSLTSSEVSARSPAWSPDGERIAFVIAGHEIWVMNKDGSDELKLTGGPDGHPAWSPDGRTIAFEHRAGVNDLTSPSSIYLIAADGHQKRQLTRSGVKRDTAPRWSPDGHTVVFARGIGLTDLYLIESDGTGLSRLTGTGLDSLPAWSPDGHTIVFVRSGASGRRIMAIEPDGADARALTPPDIDATDPTWSPDGDEIVFSALGRRCYDILCFSHGHYEAIHVMGSSGIDPEAPVELELTEGSDTAPAWQPAPQKLGRSQQSGSA